MPRTKEANERIREATRSRILESAQIVFERKRGATTMADVASEAGVSYGLVYRHFKSKEALLRAVLEARAQKFALAMRRVMTGIKPGGDALDFRITVLVEFSRKFAWTRRQVHEIPSDKATYGDIRKFVSREGRASWTKLRRLIVEGQKRGDVIQGDPDQLVFAVRAFLEGLTELSAYNERGLEKHFPDARILLRILRPCGGNKGLQPETRRSK